MKRHHSITLGGKALTLSLSFRTSLNIREQVASPSFIVETLLNNYQAAQDGRPLASEFEFNEENAVQILTLANAEFEALSFDEMGELAIEEGFLATYGAVVSYLREMVLGRSKEMDKTPDKAAEGN